MLGWELLIIIHTLDQGWFNTQILRSHLALSPSCVFQIGTPYCFAFIWDMVFTFNLRMLRGIGFIRYVISFDKKYFPSEKFRKIPWSTLLPRVQTKTIAISWLVIGHFWNEMKILLWLKPFQMFLMGFRSGKKIKDWKEKSAGKQNIDKNEST